MYIRYTRLIRSYAPIMSRIASLLDVEREFLLERGEQRPAHAPIFDPVVVVDSRRQPASGQNETPLVQERPALGERHRRLSPVQRLRNRPPSRGDGSGEAQGVVVAGPPRAGGVEVAEEREPLLRL